MTADVASSTSTQERPEPMLRGNYYADGLYLRTQVQRGVTRNRHGTRMVALSEDFLNGFRRAVGDECGPAAALVFKTCGRKWGALLARRFDTELSEFHGQAVQEFTVAMFLACLSEMFSHHGWGRLHLDLTDHDHGIIVAELHGAVMAALVGQAEQPADVMMAGIFAGFFAHLTGQDLDCLQTSCTACGADASRFIITLKQRLAAYEPWVQQGRTHQEILARLRETPT